MPQAADLRVIDVSIKARGHEPVLLLACQRPGEAAAQDEHGPHPEHAASREEHEPEPADPVSVQGPQVPSIGFRGKPGQEHAEHQERK